MTTTDPTDFEARCGACEYDLRGLIDPDRCPECGTKVTVSMLEPAIASEPDAGDAIERSGLGIIAAATWASFIPLSGLMLKPYIGGLLVVIFLFGSLARLVGWIRFLRGPLREFDDIRFELVVRIVTFLEIGLLAVIVIGALGRWTIPIDMWWGLVTIGTLIGGSAIALPAFSTILLGRRVSDPVLRGVGFATIIATGLSVPLILVATFVSFNLQVRRTPPSDVQTIIYFGSLVTGLALAAIAAHLGRIAITGLQSVLLELFIAKTSDRPRRVRIGGAWISADKGPRPEIVHDPVDAEPIPLSPRKPPVRDRNHPEP
ncbi:MAG: hypothetical protein GY895_04355 [Phycisphaera sp.]|nr:hypothetical protein [Phycisphaera sp.]